MQFCRFLNALLFTTALLASGAPAAGTINDADLRTWWHAGHEMNDATPVADHSVRRSTFFDTRVGKLGNTTSKYDSFPYMSIPRGGREKWLYTEDDGAEFADQANLTMSWTSFLYSKNAWVEISLKNGTIASLDDVTIRPAAFNLVKEWVNNTTVRVLVPYSPKGYRFSVEFANHSYHAHNDMSDETGKLNDRGIGRHVHTEPRNAMMVFAEPMVSAAEAARVIPTVGSGSIHYVQPGLVNNLHLVTKQIVHFGPGVYYMPHDRHAQLGAGVRWVYLAPGAYVKGAFEFLDTTQKEYKVTGFGVISGEKYVYEADTMNKYQHSVGANCHGTCVKLLRLASSDMQQTLHLHGVTLNEPPYHSFVVYGNEDTMRMRVDQFKQVGGWYWQTDGLELYTNGVMNNTFFHSNDDVLKIYHSNLSINNTVIWKGENGPVIQWGWKPRNIDNVVVRDTHVIHNRMYWRDVKGNTCLFNAAPALDENSGPNPAFTVSNFLFENFRVEGKTNCGIRLYALANHKKIHLKNVDIEAWNDLDIYSQASKFTAVSPNIVIGNETIQSEGIKLENYRIGNERIYKAGTNWNSTSRGRLDFDPAMWDHWNAW